MRRATPLLAITASMLAGCGGTSAGPAPVEFTGPPWTVTLTTDVDCGGGQTGATSTMGQVGFLPSSEADEILASSEAGCAFKLHVAGNTATLVNGPVVCGTTSNGQAFEYSFASYTATIVDGGRLTIAAGETENFGGATCRLTITGSGAR